MDTKTLSCSLTEKCQILKILYHVNITMSSIIAIFCRFFNTFFSTLSAFSELPRVHGSSLVVESPSWGAFPNRLGLGQAVFESSGWSGALSNSVSTPNYWFVCGGASTTQLSGSSTFTLGRNNGSAHPFIGFRAVSWTGELLSVCFTNITLNLYLQPPLAVFHNRLGLGQAVFESSGWSGAWSISIETSHSWLIHGGASSRHSAGTTSKQGATGETWPSIGFRAALWSAHMGI